MVKIFGKFIVNTFYFFLDLKQNYVVKKVEILQNFYILVPIYTP